MWLAGFRTKSPGIPNPSVFVQPQGKKEAKKIGSIFRGIHFVRFDYGKVSSVWVDTDEGGYCHNPTESCLVAVRHPDGTHEQHWIDAQFSYWSAG